MNNFQFSEPMSASGPLTGFSFALSNVRFWPKADMPKNAIDVAIGVKRTWPTAPYMSAFDHPAMFSDMVSKKRTATEVLVAGREYLKGHVLQLLVINYQLVP